MELSPTPENITQAPDVQAEPAAKPANPPAKAKSWRKIVKRASVFAKEHKKPLMIVAAAVILMATLYVMVPVIPAGSLRIVNTDTNVRIENGQMARLKDGGISVSIDSFINDSCPHPGKCYGADSIQAVIYKLQVDGKTYYFDSASANDNTRYHVETIKSDYKTYAEIKITPAKK